MSLFDKHKRAERSVMKVPAATCPNCKQLGLTVFYGDLGVAYLHKCGMNRFIAWADMPALREHQFFGTEAERKEAAMSPLQLPTKPTASGWTPMHARILLIGHPKVGKSTLAASWAPDKTLILDTHNGTRLLPGEHYVQPINSYQRFTEAVDLLAKGDHQFTNVVIDTIDDIYKFADAAAGDKSGKVAAGLVDFGKGTAYAEAVFRRDVGKLLATTYGVWFIGHADDIQVDNKTRFVPKLDKRVRTFIEGSTDYIWFAERTGPRAVVLNTQPTDKYVAGSRTQMPERMPLTINEPEQNARALYAAMNAGLNKPTATASAVKTNDTKKVAA